MKFKAHLNIRFLNLKIISMNVRFESCFVNTLFYVDLFYAFILIFLLLSSVSDIPTKSVVSIFSSCLLPCLLPDIKKKKYSEYFGIYHLYNKSDCDQVPNSFLDCFLRFNRNDSIILSLLYHTTLWVTKQSKNSIV